MYSSVFSHMKNFRKILSFFICFVFCLQVGVFAADSGDAAEFSYEQELALLDSLNILSAESFHPADELTRAKACELVTNMMSGSQINFSGTEEMYFTDVAPENAYFEAVSNAVKLGIINGYPNSSFLPDAPVTYMQFYKMLVIALGYGQQAEISGGYPAGHLKYVQTLKLNRKINRESNENVTLNDAVILLCTALDTDICQIKTIGEATEYQVTKGVTLLTEMFEIYNETGIMTATPISSLTSPESSLQNGRVMIDGDLYLDAKPADYENIGRYVKVFYKQEAGEEKSVFRIVPDENRNAERTIKADDILAFDANKNEYTLDKEGRTETVRLSKSVDVLINEKACADYLADDMKPSCGEVRLIDNNNDGEYDVIKIVSYENYVISKIDTNSGTIYAKNRTDTLVLDEDDKNLIVYVDDGSEDFAISRLAADMVISVAMSADTGGKKFAKILTSDETAEGEISELDSGFENINLGGEIYPVEDSYRKQLADENGSGLSAGRYAVFSLNAFGKIVYADTNASSRKKYAFLIDIQPQKSLTEQMKVKLLMADGNFKVFTCGEKIILNTTQIDSERLADAITYQFASTNTYTHRQLVSYETKGENELRRICTYDTFSKNIQKEIFVRGDLFGANSRLSSAAPVFVIPNDENINTDQVEDAFLVLKASACKADTKYDFEFFDYDDIRFAGAAVQYITFGKKSDTLPERTALTLIQKVGKAVDENGEEVCRITGLTNGGVGEKVLYPDKITYRSRDGSVISGYNPQAGDIIAFGENTAGYVNCVQIFYQENGFGDAFFYTSHSSGRFDGEMSVFGAEILQFQNGKDAVFQAIQMIACSTESAMVSIADRGRYRKASVSEISVGDFVVGRMRYGSLLDLIIIRK